MIFDGEIPQHHFAIEYFGAIFELSLQLQRGPDGNTSSEYRQTVTIGGQSEIVVGTACLGADGAWTMQNS